MGKKTKQYFYTKLLLLLMNETSEFKKLNAYEIASLMKEKDEVLDIDHEKISGCISQLNSVGFNIQKIKSKGSSETYDTFYYSPCTSFLSNSEALILRMLVTAAPFLDKKSTADILNKLRRYSIQNSISSKIELTENAVKKENSSFLENFEKCMNAIETKSKVQFDYYYINTFDQYIEKKGSKEKYVIAPLRIDFENIRLNAYLIRFNYETKEQRFFRLDRMENLEILNEKYDTDEDVKNISLKDLISNQYNRYKAETKVIKLFIDETKFKHAIEEVKRNCKEIYDDSKICIAKEKYELKCTAAINDFFYAWLASFSDSITLVGPEDIKNGYLNFLEKTVNVYNYKVEEYKNLKIK